MPVLHVVVVVEIDGQPLAGFPFARRMSLAQGEAFDFSKASGGGYATLPIDKISTLQALIARADQAVTIRLNGQSDAGIPLNAQGLLLILDAGVNAGATVNATINNTAADAAQVKGYGAGT